MYESETRYRYTNADQWGGVVSTLRRSFSRNGSLDEMLSFSDISLANLRPIDGVSMVSYSAQDDLMALVRYPDMRRQPLYKDPRAHST